MICFVIAMDKEAAPVISAMEHVKEKKLSGKRVVFGTLFKKKIAIVVCGVGKVNAACGTQLAIDKLKAEKIVNIGVAGGLNKGVAVGEVYQISHVVQYDFDLVQISGKPVGTLDGYEENYLPLHTCGKYSLKRLATGDRFNDSKDDYKLLTKELGADVRDMEGGAVAQVCMQTGLKCYSYKIISDLAGSGSTTEQYKKNLALCFETLKRELKNITDEIYG
ncbi:MAG: 5'-methylthioadenosine/S-adenosylhomocysteine nucleosidase [Clostridia bacterium]|nr:5'-methylthioadenosine/S-adenosylhomocysteine nucleosidase [Clostridia bacterium]